MYGEEKSDSLIVAAKQANNPKGAESVERGAGPRGTRNSHTCAGHRAGKACHRGCHAWREAAKQRKKERFTALFHLLTVEALEAAFLSLSRKAAAGVDGIRWMDYRRKHEEQHNRSAPEATSGQLQGAARQASLHPKSGWKTTPARHRLAGGQDRPVCAGENPERSL